MLRFLLYSSSNAFGSSSCVQLKTEHKPETESVSRISQWLQQSSFVPLCVLFLMINCLKLDLFPCLSLRGWNLISLHYNIIKTYLSSIERAKIPKTTNNFIGVDMIDLWWKAVAEFPLKKIDNTKLMYLVRLCDVSPKMLFIDTLTFTQILRSVHLLMGKSWRIEWISLAHFPLLLWWMNSTQLFCNCLHFHSQLEATRTFLVDCNQTMIEIDWESELEK